MSEAPSSGAAAELPVEGELADFDGANAWLNSEPLTPAGLRGKVVVVEFCTFSCVNWLRTLPYVRAWDERYRDDGLVVIGAHTPEFEFEHDVEKIRSALEEMGVRYPIAVDNDYAVWRAFDNNYWPALYFADVEGRLRHHHFGEEDYQRSERVIQQLLTEAGATGVDDGLVSVDAGGVYAPADWETLGLAGDLRRLRPGGGVRFPRRPGARPQSCLRRASSSSTSTSGRSRAIGPWEDSRRS